MTYIVKKMPTHVLTNRLVAILAYDGVNAFELGIAHEVFGLPNMGPGWYEMSVCAAVPSRPCRASHQLGVVADAGLPTMARAGTVVVAGWDDIDAAPPPVLLTALRRAHARGARIVSICSGVFVLAAAGLLQGRRVAVHWAQAEALAQRYPELEVDATVLYVDDGDVLTSAGRAAGLDLCVHVVRRDFGPEVANQVARRLVIPVHREGGQAQFIPRHVVAHAEPLSGLLEWAREHLDEDLSIERMAERARMSRRTFIRRFEATTGSAPGTWVMQERLSRACGVLEATGLSIEEVATTTGFGSAENMRHHFRARLGTSPARYRLSFCPT
jgi:AraC family transcriptional regulator, transcriptional activator FtrA